MSNLTPELKKKIEQEATSSAANYHYYPGSEQFEDMESAYETGSFKYAEKWQEEKELRERYEKALKEIRDMEHSTPDAYAMKLKAYWALKPKTSKDEQANHEES